ncbi:MAG TPA: UvrD-helicase domain-containing protein [Actinomycetes bacterium]|nr:UvrD-helicase domain-containing protein [Actinomycetes bacterium]
MPEPFDLLGPLPTGTTVLEASAGTGKTFTIANLVARYVADGVPMESLLVVSFSRESTRELRERVRERLVSARDGLARPATIADDDLVLGQIADAEAEAVDVRRKLFEEALTVFDSATVTTTHGFCQQVMLALGTAGDHDTGAVLVESIGDLVAEVADDLYLRKWGAAAADPPDMSRADFHALATAAALDPATELLPPADTDGLPGQRARIAAAVRTEVDRRKRRQQLIGYDDMLIRLRDTLVDPTTGPIARRRLRARYQVVLVDEFQDTDPVQWTILREAFHGHRTLVLIGDPKQAIYGFRGADVHAYLEARESASVVRTLPTNHRSDRALLDGMSAVFGGAALGDERIRVLPVEAAHDGRLVDAEVPLQLRVVPREGLPAAQNGTVRTGPARELVAHDLADRVVSLLSGGTSLQPRDAREPTRGLAPGDIAVLVRQNSQAALVQTYLQAVGVPVILTGKTSVFATHAAAEWQRLLEALEQPHRTTRVRRVALTCFVGLDAAGLDAAGDAYADDLALQLRIWGSVLDERGVAAMFEAVSLDLRLQPRLLGQVGGERLLTDLRHIAQVMHEAALEGQLGLTALLVWLRRRREEAARESGQERSRRLETDADAVQIITVHTSKGLEFPVVLVPFAWDNWKRDDPPTAVFHDERDHRVRDVGGVGSPDWAAHVKAHKQEEIDDELRLTYVALTRAQSHLLVWWAPSYNTPTSPLHRLLMHEGPDLAPQQVKVPDDGTTLAALTARAARSGGGMAVEVVLARPPARWSPEGRPAPSLSLARFDRALDTGWRRTSYTALTSGAHEQRLGSEPESAQKDDETDLEEVPAESTLLDVELRGVVSLWDTIPGGAAFGTLVHSAVEHISDLGDDAEVASVVGAQVARWTPELDAGLLSRAMSAAFATPLGPLADGVPLSSVAAADRLPELDFELPLAGGDEALDRQVLLSQLVPLWRSHVPTGSLATYADALAELPDVPLRGYLTGSIDAVLRVGAAPSPRYVVVDYKTNRLGGHDEPLTAWHYRSSALETAMVEAHYPLQALLYSVALHRYLRWRQPGYDPDAHLGGVLYLFLRGMTGPAVLDAAGATPGVFSWRPPSGLVVGTSDLLAGLR